MALRMPREVAERARRLADGAWTPPPALPAATVVLLRDGGSGPEVLLTRRPASMAFAPGMSVFPGGRVDLPGDSLVEVAGPVLLGDWSPDEVLSRALIAAAVRETFEEAGILLAVDTRGEHPAPDAGWEADRIAVAGPGGLAAVLRRRSLVLSTHVLVPLAHWVTPEVESRRYDTRFLAARVPPRQPASPHATETDDAQWLRPGDALAEHATGRRALLPPTVAVLAELAAHRSAEEVLATASGRAPVPMMPRPVDREGAIEWALVHAYSGAVIGPGEEPAGSEVLGHQPGA